MAQTNWLIILFRCKVVQRLGLWGRFGEYFCSSVWTENRKHARPAWNKWRNRETRFCPRQAKNLCNCKLPPAHTEGGILNLSLKINGQENWGEDQMPINQTKKMVHPSLLSMKVKFSHLCCSIILHSYFQPQMAFKCPVSYVHKEHCRTTTDCLFSTDCPDIRMAQILLPFSELEKLEESLSNLP